MMPQCMVSNCSNYYGKTRGKVNIMYHIFPTKPELASKWAVLCGYKRDFKVAPYARVCSEHFTPNCYQRDLQHELLGLPLRRKLKSDAVPNKKLPTQTNNGQKTLKGFHLDKKRVDTVIKSSFGSNKSKSELPPKKPKNVLVNVNNTTKAKAKFKTNLGRSNSAFKISINELCKNKSPSLRRSDPLKESTVNKIEEKPSKSVIVEPVKKLTSLGPVRKLTRQVTIEPIYTRIPAKTEHTANKQHNFIDVKQLKNEIEIFSRSVGPSQKETNTINEFDKMSYSDPWLNRSRKERMPMRSSIRIAKKKSIESLSESFTMKVNSKKGNRDCNKRERFSDKLKFMAMLKLRYFSNKNQLDQLLGEPPGIIPLESRNR